MSGMNSAVIWLVLVIVLLAIEIATLGLTTVWFARPGAAAAFISTFFGASMGVQTGIFLVLSLILLLVTRPAAMRFMKKGQVKTNADSLIGRIAVATKEINNLAQTGEVDIADISWTARSRDDLKIIPAGSKVKICAIEGVKLIVEEIKEEIK